MLALISCLAGGIRSQAQAARPAPSIGQLKGLSFEELMDIEVTSVSKRPEKLAEAASAIQVVTGEEIRRAGVSTLPQALRLAPNLQAAQVSAGNWTIGARGFNGTTTTSNKLLVMIDGRSVYTPLFAGTFWDTQDVFLPDVDRIEVISGPGGATWGANAVNGVINIVTKSAAETQGVHLYGGAGGEERALGGLRYGGRLGDGHYRVYAKHIDLDSTVRANGASARDRYVLTQGGFRADWEKPAGRSFTLQGDLYSGWIEIPNATRAKLSGGNLLGRWTEALANGGELQAQAYYDYAWRWATSTFADRLETIDLDVQHRWAPGARHQVMWGVNYRTWIDHVRNTPTQAFIPADDTIRLAGLFGQDEVELVPQRLRLTLGAKFEHSDYSGSEIQPSVRLAWLADDRHTFWAAVSRAVRTPSRLDRDLFQPPVPPFVVAGGPNFRSEVLWAYEAGWRGRPNERLAVAVSLFWHDYDRLRSLEPTAPLPIVFGNGVAGETHGAELSVEHRPADWWRWSAGHTLLRPDIRPAAGSRDLNQGRTESADPENQTFFSLALDWPHGWELDATVRRIGQVPTFAGGVRGTVPAYTELDARVGWQLRPGVEFSLTGRNLLRARHPEAGAVASRREIERSVHGKVSWSF